MCIRPARLEADVTVDPLAVIGADAEIGAGTVIAAGAVIGPGVRIGRDCAIGAGATIQHALIGDRVDHPSGRAHRPGRFRLSCRARKAIRKFRRPAASSSRTTWRSAPTPPSTAAPPAIPSSARAPRSTIWCKSRTTCSIGRHCLIAVADRHIRQLQSGRFRHDGRAGRHGRPSSPSATGAMLGAQSRRHDRCSRRRPLASARRPSRCASG